ncbi:hypothetical protein [Streptosporangium sp. NPDC006007]|uniref:SGNH/GDSL hydrolase family protein n=1 Tax=Streptosporangium sp. NPDC006007 TaxID=3154575 RepID=UPI0033AD6FEC
MNTAMTERLIRFQHPEKVLGYLGGLDDDRIAALFGLDLDSYRRSRRGYDEQACGAAAELLDDPGFAEKVDRLPFKPGQRVVALGESTTDDLLSWFEILRHVIALRRPADGITLVNMAVSGHTSTQALTLLPGLSFHRPDWVLCMLGGNDAQRLGPADGPTWSVSPRPGATSASCVISSRGAMGVDHPDRGGRDPRRGLPAVPASRDHLGQPRPRRHRADPDRAAGPHGRRLRRHRPAAGGTVSP